MIRQLAPAGSSLSLQPQQQEEAAPITEAEVVGYREQDRFLPINNIQRLMKRSLPESSKISKDAKGEPDVIAHIVQCQSSSDAI